MAKKKKIKTGEIWIVELTKNPSDVIGHEQANKRPCLVLVLNNNVDLATIIPFTSSKSALHLPHTFLVKKTTNNQLKSDSVAMIFHLRSLSFQRFQIKIGIILNFTS